MKALQNSLRVGVIAPERRCEQIDGFIRQLLGTEQVELRIIALVPGRGRATSLPFLLRSWTGLERWWTRRHRKIEPTADARPPEVETVHLDERAPGALETGLNRMRSHALDVLIDVRAGGAPADFSAAANYGMWKVFNPAYPEATPEQALLSVLYEKHETYELILRTTTAGTRNTLYRSSFSTHKLALERNLVLDRERRSQILLRRLSDLVEHGWTNIAGENTGLEPGGPPRSVGTGLLFLAQRVGRYASHLIRRLWSEEQWVIATSNEDGPTRAEAGNANATVIAPVPSKNCADPFLFVHKGKNYLFYESWQTGGKGTIWCAEIDSNGVPADAREVLRRGYHLSYPFVFEWKSEIYMTPETEENKSVEVYRAVEMPWHWEPASVLLKNVSAVDPTICEYNGRLWLFVSGLGGTAMYSNELSLFFAESLFGPWHSHPKNPVVCDVYRARPAGALLWDGDTLLRPGQDCSKRYGYAVSLNRVDLLSETDYRETPVGTIPPNWLPGILATHTLNTAAGLRVMDAVRRVPRYTHISRSSAQDEGRLRVLRTRTTFPRTRKTPALTAA